MYTDSLIVLDARTGKLQWYDQVTPHDIRDHDFEATPMLVTANGTKLVIGGGKGGTRSPGTATHANASGRRPSAMHRNDTGPLPRHRVTVCPGLYGGIETPMAYASGRVFVPVVNLCGWSSAISRPEASQPSDRAAAAESSSPSTQQTGTFSGIDICPSPDFGCATAVNDIVFTSTWAGMVYAFAAKDGKLLWQTG